jgi:dihydropyrimidinase
MEDIHALPPLDLVVSGGTVATAEGSRAADIGIRNGRIAVLADRIDPRTAASVMDASGCLIVPGAIDVHTHFGNEVGEHGTADDYESGTLAAAFGGITTVINYCIQKPGEPLTSAIERDRSAADPLAMTDYGLHVIITDPALPDLASQLQAAASAGCPSVKIFTAVADFAISDSAILQVLRAAAATGLMVNLHAEDGSLVDDLTHDLIHQGKTGIAFLPDSRPPVAEAIAIRKVAAYAGTLGVPLYIVHVSSRAALDAIAEARANGVEIYAETRPAYLFLDQGIYTSEEERGRYVACWPPLRSVEDQAALWDGLRSGFIQTYATDHTSWMAAEKLNPDLTFDAIPGGFASVETSIGMLFSEGVAQNRITLERFVAVTATNPAKIFGLWPRKGTIAVGSDADLVLIDPAASVIVAPADMHSRSDVEPYAGYQASGWPVTTISRGEVVVDRGKLLGHPGRGKFAARDSGAGARASTIGM